MSDNNVSPVPTRKQPTAANTIGVFMMALMGMAFSVITPAMGSILSHYMALGVANPTYISTMYCITMVPVTLITGVILNTGKVNYRFFAILGNVMMLIFGCLPALIPDPSYGFMLVCRALMGVGLGFVTPLGNAVILNCYEGKKQSMYMGLATTFMNLGGIAFQNIGSVLNTMGGANGYHLCFWGYAFCLVGVIGSFLIPEPKKFQAAAPAAAAGDAPKIKEKMGIIPIILGVFLFIFNLMDFPIMMYAGTMLHVSGAEALAGICLTFFTIGGMISGAIFGATFKVIKRFIIGVGWIICGLGVLIVYFTGATGSFIGISFGLFLLGWGFGWMFPGMMMLVGMRTPPSRVALGTAILMAIMNLSSFFSSMYMGAVAGMVGAGLDSIATVLQLCLNCSIVYIVCGIIFFVWRAFPKAPAAPAPAEQK